ncbi:MAG: hypothetical protein ABF313_03965, partial [Marivita sp.]
LMNEGKWNSLSADAQTAIMSHGGAKMAQMGGDAYTDVGESIRKDVVAEGRIEVVTPDQATIEKYAGKAKTVHDAWIAATPNGQAVYDTAVKLLVEMRGAS